MNPLPRFLLPLICLALGSAAVAAGLPDPLRLADGTRTNSPAIWQERNRPELLELFREHIYGRAPIDRPEDLRFEILEAETPALDGKALRKRVRIAYSGPGGEGGLTLTCYFPAETPAKACVTLIVNRSPRIIDEAESRPSAFWPVADLIARGYATAAFHYSEAAPDRAATSFAEGVFRVFGPDAADRPDDAWGAVAAWAWAASRAIDYLETEPRLAGVPLALAGHSRGGKAALWCGAQDTRVALTISNNSGCTGAALARGTTGETVAVINRKFPHWFSAAYKTYGDRVDDLPVDQHALLALIAPRRAYVASASEDDNADPRAEFAACVAAAPVFALHGLGGVGEDRFPAVGEARHAGAIGYHLRAGKHDLTREDWARFMDYTESANLTR